MSGPLNILMIEDSEADAALVERELRLGIPSVEVLRVANAQGVAEALASRRWDIVLSDYALPGYDVLSALETVCASQPEIPFVVVSGTIGEERAFDLMRRGVADYCLKDNLARLTSIVDRAVREARDHAALDAAEKRLMVAAREWSDTFDAISDLVLVLDPEGNVSRLNRAAAQRLGLAPDDAVGRDVLDLVVSLSHEQQRANIERFRTQGVECFELGPCGNEESWYEVNIDPLLSDTRKPLGWVAVFSDITERKRSEGELRSMVDKLERSMRGSVSIATHMVEKRDPYTAGHQEGVAKYAVCIADGLGMSAEQIDVVRTASLLHDIGKIAVPAEILVKPTKLDEYEWLIIQRHPQVGAEILDDAELGGPIAEIIRQHHERLDGSGYPSGLSGTAICVEARIIAVADVTEAMLAHRPYRPARTLEETSNELERGRGRLYDPQVVDACLAVLALQI